ncbi:MAG: D-alanine--D-alanine ligase family protein [Eubacteriales bacterium]|nr:D-alanine--D-alanine ligase family protein [Eubacteriales bacterium]
MEKKKILVLFGGCSPEYDVSLESAYSVITKIDRAKYQVLTVGITRQGDWYYFEGDPREIAEDRWQNHAVLTMLSPNRTKGRGLLLPKQGKTELSDGLRTLAVDVVFPVLHGQNGEDGTVQGLCALAGLPVVGCSVLASALGMDKARAHRLAKAAGVETPEGFVLERTAAGLFDAETGEKQDRTALADRAGRLGYPLFVKPVRAGSSFGVTRAEGPWQLQKAIEQALCYDSQVLVEACVPGFETGCAVLGNETLFVGEVDEIALAEGFFDYTEKYGLYTSRIYVPARISETQAARIKETACRVYRALGCQGFARVDLFLTPEGRVVFHEVNTIPGFTSHSRFPGMLRAAGLSLEQVLDRAIDLALLQAEQPERGRADEG